MRILLLAPPNYEFSVEIKKELENQGHIVNYVEDKTFELDYFLSYNNKSKRFLKYILGKSTKRKEQYWNYLFNAGGELYQKEFDFLLCINGYSLCSSFFSKFNEYSQKAPRVYYLWDSTRLYAFNKNFEFFDKCYTFDYKDAKDYQIEYLPMFWLPEKNIVSGIKAPRVFFAGTIHSDRYKIIKRIVTQLDILGIDYYIKLYVPSNHKPFLRYRAKINRLFHKDNVINDLDRIENGKEKESFIIHHPISLEIFNKEMLASSHILDIEQPCQTALTPRVIQALAMKKRIITTNKWLSSMSWITGVEFLDRNNPIINNLSNIQNNCEIDDNIQKLRIDKWILNLINLDK